MVRLSIGPPTAVPHPESVGPRSNCVVRDWRLTCELSIAAMRPDRRTSGKNKCNMDCYEWLQARRLTEIWKETFMARGTPSRFGEAIGRSFAMSELAQIATTVANPRHPACRTRRLITIPQAMLALPLLAILFVQSSTLAQQPVTAPPPVRSGARGKGRADPAGPRSAAGADRVVPRQPDRPDPDGGDLPAGGGGSGALGRGQQVAEGQGAGRRAAQAAVGPRGEGADRSAAGPETDERQPVVDAEAG